MLQSIVYSDVGFDQRHCIGSTTCIRVGPRDREPCSTHCTLSAGDWIGGGSPDAKNCYPYCCCCLCFDPLPAAPSPLLCSAFPHQRDTLRSLSSMRAALFACGFLLAISYPIAEGFTVSFLLTKVGCSNRHRMTFVVTHLSPLAFLTF